MFFFGFQMIGTIVTYELVLMQFDKSDPNRPAKVSDLFCRLTNRVQ